MGREENPTSITRHARFLYELLEEEEFDEVIMGLDAIAFQQAAWEVDQEENFDGDHCTGAEDLGSFVDRVPNTIQRVTEGEEDLRFPSVVHVPTLRGLINNVINSQIYGTPFERMFELIRQAIGDYIVGCMRQLEECPEDASWPRNIPANIFAVLARIMLRIQLDLLIALRDWYNLLEFD